MPPEEHLSAILLAPHDKLVAQASRVLVKVFMPLDVDLARPPCGDGFLWVFEDRRINGGDCLPTEVVMWSGQCTLMPQFAEQDVEIWHDRVGPAAIVNAQNISL
ncbi:MAG: hypothetical protein ACR2PI_06855 [Hyphomicrobiaceae bacterium]